jgi:hypothetical protein
MAEETFSTAEAALRSEEFLSLSREDQEGVIRARPALAEAAARIGFRPGLRQEQAGPWQWVPALLWAVLWPAVLVRE